MHSHLIIYIHRVTCVQSASTLELRACPDTLAGCPYAVFTGNTECPLFGANRFPLLILEITTCSLFYKQLQSETK